MDRRTRVVKGTSIITVALCGTILAGCGRSGQVTNTPPEAETTVSESVAVLADTDWRLVEIQSMDDAVGTVRPDDSNLYTMRLNGDGTANMRLNCNRASGTWTIEPSADPSNGHFEFGPLAMTRALCPPPSLDEQVAAQAEYIRGYLHKGSRLYLSLMADGGIFVWEAHVPFQAEADAEIEAAILQASPSYTREMVDIDGRKARYVYSRIDLNGDGRDEVFVYTLGSIFCGTGGCDLLLFTESGDGYTLVNDFPISREPVIVSAERANGWNNLIRLESGGGAPPTYVTHTFDGQQYVEQERVPADTAPEGVPCLTGGFTFEDGVILEPRN